MAWQFKSLALQRKLQLAMVLGTVLALLLAGLAVLSYETSTFRPRVERQLDAVAKVMADINQASLDFDDARQAQDNLAFLRLYEGIDAGALYRADGSLFAEWASNNAKPSSPVSAPTNGTQFERSRASLSLPVLRDGRELGRVWIRVQLPPLLQRLPQYGIMFGALALAVMVLGAVLLWAGRHLVSQPMERLSAAADKVGRTGDFSLRVPKDSDDEIGQLTDEFNRMLAVVGERDQALLAANDLLEQRVLARSQELEQAMTLLMQNEKLAALGNVVAGVAHELNTPIGNALLAATSLGKGTQHMREQISGNSLSRRGLEEFMASVEEGSGIVSRSLERAAGLVRSFKAVAVNETSEARMDFDLRHVLDDCMALLMPGLKHRPIEVTLDCAEGIRCNSYPGALTQIVSNLVENAARHGLEPIGGGRVEVQVQESSALPDPLDADGGKGMGKNKDQDQGWLTLQVRDSGAGIPAEHLHRIFEPFFTTRLGQGGSGLGLHVVHSLAKTPLGGTIEVRSQVGQGTTFELRFPRRAPLDQL
ncbi:ATP-binding protein [Roseateles albus]|uniref:Signal transduction histidine-protein kinase/phosphatase MprB n=1 Tax=Roseateles albus TaxID=2987525 RepID=A0ABT5KG17_9BURK|nr:ATP-binding protein [Roseateles albus]MDC8772838.1 ATP-binding protein [Roseateles albus]